MDFIVGICSYILGKVFLPIIWNWYPFWVALSEWWNRDPGLNRHRMTSARLALLEYYLVQIVNETRKERGEGPVEHKALVESFEGHSWTLLRSKVRQVAQATVLKLSWVREVPS